MRPPVPPFTQETALQKVRSAEDNWNGRNPLGVSFTGLKTADLKTIPEFQNSIYNRKTSGKYHG